MKLQDMTIQEKIDKLEELINKADEDATYAIQIEWASNSVDDKVNIRNLINNIKDLLTPGKMDVLDPDIQSGFFADKSVMLDSYLKMFPEFKHDDIYTESNEYKMHI